MIGSQKSKKIQNTEATKTKTTTKKQDAKQKNIKHDDSKQNKTTSRK